MSAFGGRLLPAVACGLLIASSHSITAQSPVSPDITGSWMRQGFTVGVRPTGEPTPAAPPPAPPPSLKPAYAKEWQAKLQAIREADAKGQPFATNAVACLPDGMPGMMTAVFPMEILQSRGQVTIIQEAYTQVRRILMDRPQKALDDIEPGFFGHSVGHWEGDTLLVDTIGVKESVRYQNVPHSKEMRIRERMRLVAPDTLLNEITIEDPTVLEKPWTFTFAYQRMKDYTLLEYICEDNREYKDDQGRQQIRVDPSQR
jgi:hypothetical protein